MFLTTVPQCIPLCLNGRWFPQNLHISQGKHILTCTERQHISLAAGLTQMVRTSSHACQWYFTSQCWLARERTQSNTYFITQLTVLKLLCQISSWIHIYQWVIKLYWAHYCLKCQSWVVLLERWKHLDGYNSILEPRWTYTWICLRFVLHVCNSR